ncbi:MAG: cytochrome c biogenesis protein CcsA [Paludibacteraceae bacterium]|nr:cytochrome c biogenesis protein CcsA [Paludibacteraceae bacterium]
MNKPLKYHGYRFCQSDYDSDRQGVVLAYNYDPWGIGITYAGYALLLVAMIAFFFQKRSRFRALLKQSILYQRSGLYSISAAVLIVVLAIIMTKVVTPKPPLQPVLQTPLLGIHVSVIMLAYTLFAVIMVNGIIGIYAAIASKKAEGARKEKLEIINHKFEILSQILLYPALFCLTAGIFIGAVWANMSWGRYWGWDPKETWALITMLVYAALLHFPWLKSLTAKRSVVYHVLCVINFLFVLFTYFGVSYLLGGLHSYAN